MDQREEASAMNDVDRERLPPAPPAPPPAAAPWQERLEVIAVLLLLSAAVTVVARLASAYDQFNDLATARMASTNVVDVLQFAGQQIGILAAGSVVIAYLLVTLGPGDRISARGVLALRGATVVGLAVAGLTAFAAVATAFRLGVTTTSFAEEPSSARDLLDRISVAGPLVLAASIAGYVGWCAFATLGEVPALTTAADGEQTHPSGAS
jgi:hypothetical protein